MRLSAGSGPTFGVDDLACAAATHLGAWEALGLRVSWTPALGGLNALRMVLDGEVDAAYGGLGPALQLRAEGAPVRIVVSMARALAQNLVVQADLTQTAALRNVNWAIDGRGALSHHMARLIVQALQIEDDAVNWRVVGPPPERIASLLFKEVDASLLRVEEALALSRDPANTLHTLLGFSDLKALLPIQPHGVLSTTEAFERANGEALARLAKGMIIASRRIHDSFEDFLSVYRAHVTVQLETDEIERIWRQERDSGGFAVNGEMTDRHWSRQVESFARLNPHLPAVRSADFLAGGFVTDALAELGVRNAPDAPDTAAAPSAASA